MSSRLLFLAAALPLAAWALVPIGAGSEAHASAAATADPAAAPLGAEEGRTVASELADQLERNFVIPENGRDYAAMLRRNAAAGRYDSGTRGSLARLLNDDLLAVHKDGHLRVNVERPEPAGGNPGGFKAPLVQSAREIAPGVGYIRFTAFFGTSEQMASVRQWLADNARARTLIIDLRNHHGGGLAEQDLIFSQIYGQRTPLVRMEMARAIYDTYGSPLPEGDTVRFSPRGSKVEAIHQAIPAAGATLTDAKILVLTSNRSASAAEHFALALKSTRRGVLIGEATAGANHFGGPSALNANFHVWMPIGRTSDLATGQDWEGTGVAPDIAVDPQQALIVALKMAGQSEAEAIRLNAEEIPAEPVHSDKVRAR